LVEQRLEEVMVAAVDGSDADGHTGETMYRLQPAETGADYNDVMTVGGRIGAHQASSFISERTRCTLTWCHSSGNSYSSVSFALGTSETLGKHR
jgi:hypothetical protein